MTENHSLANHGFDSVVDVAIVGGGAAGTYAAFRLGEANRHKDSSERSVIAIFESSNRIGGRLRSEKVPEVPCLRADLGGVGFPEIHENVFNLCKKELKLDVIPCKPFSRQYFYYLRRHRFVDDDFREEDPFPEHIPYFLTRDERENFKQGWAFFVAGILGRCIEGSEERINQIFDALKRADDGDVSAALQLIDQNIQELRDAEVKFSDGSKEKIYKVGFWNLLEDKMSTEAWRLISYSGFALSFFRNWNMYDSVRAFYESAVVGSYDPPYWELKNGFQELPLTLEKRFLEIDSEKHSTHLNHTVKSLHRIVVDGKPYIRMEVLNPDGALMEVVAKNVILALPKRALRLLDNSSVMYESTAFDSQLEAVEATPAFKTFMSFEKPWWRDAVPKVTIEAGYSTTDLPIRACYYMGVDEKTGYGLINASLSDEFMTQFWSGYMQESLDRDSPRRFENYHADQIPPELRPPERMIHEMRWELASMHGVDVKEVPEPTDAICFDWTNDPYGGGWHSWKPNLRSWEVMKKIRYPVSDPESRVFICGEAYSASQGWVEGALNTAEMVLQTYFDLPRPCWVPDKYEFGP